MGAFIDLTGKKFGRMLVLSRAANDRGGRAKWNCVCDCGTMKDVASYDLRSGHTTSCGCIGRERAAQRLETHGLSNGGDKTSPVYNVWSKMKGRCYSKGNNRYYRYGARGITVCENWHDFQNFHDWAMSNGYEKGLQIDRIDNNGNYCPENCRWVDVATNCRNRSTSKLTVEKVKRIKKMIRRGERTRDIAMAFGVGATSISNIKHGRSWVDVE